MFAFQINAEFHRDLVTDTASTNALEILTHSTGVSTPPVHSMGLIRDGPGGAPCGRDLEVSVFLADFLGVSFTHCWAA